MVFIYVKSNFIVVIFILKKKEKEKAPEEYIGRG